MFKDVPGCIEGIPGHYGMFRGVPGVFRGVLRVFRGCSGGVPGCSGVFRGVPGVFRVLQTPIILCMFFHNSRSKHSRKTTSCTSITSVRLRQIIAFNFDCRVHLFVQLSIFLS